MLMYVYICLCQDTVKYKSFLARIILFVNEFVKEIDQATRSHKFQHPPPSPSTLPPERGAGQVRRLQYQALVHLWYLMYQAFFGTGWYQLVHAWCMVSF
jgi:hypothetical protein